MWIWILVLIVLLIAAWIWMYGGRGVQVRLGGRSPPSAAEESAPPGTKPAKRRARTNTVEKTPVLTSPTKKPPPAPVEVPNRKTLLVIHHQGHGLAQWKKAIKGLPLNCIYSTNRPSDWSELRSVPVVWIGEAAQYSMGFEKHHPEVCRAMIFWYPDRQVSRGIGQEYSFLVAGEDQHASDNSWASLAERRYYADGTPDMRTAITEILDQLHR